MGLSIRAYARQRGVSHVAVLRAVKQGRIALEADGTVDPAKANASWERSSDPSRKKDEPTPRPSSLRPVAEAAVGSVRETLKEQGLPFSGNLTFVQARTAHEIAKALLARLRLQERRGELVDRANAAALVFRLARKHRQMSHAHLTDEGHALFDGLFRSRNDDVSLHDVPHGRCGR